MYIYSFKILILDRQCWMGNNAFSQSRDICHSFVVGSIKGT